MSEKKFYTVTREEIQEAMNRYLQKGGKINRIESLHKAEVEYFDGDSLVNEESSSLDLNFIDRNLG